MGSERWWECRESTRALLPISTLSTCRHCLAFNSVLSATSFANNYITFHDHRYRSWGLLGGFCRFQSVSVVGIFVQLSGFSTTAPQRLSTANTNPDFAAAINNVIGLSVATLTNFLLNVTLTWNRRGRGRRFTYG